MHIKTNGTIQPQTQFRPDMVWIVYEVTDGIPEIMFAGDEAAAKAYWEDAMSVFGDEPCNHQEDPEITARNSWDYGFYGAPHDTQYRCEVLPYRKVIE